MDFYEFIPKCKALVTQHINKNVLEDGEPWLSQDRVFVVWSSKTLQNAKAILAAPGPNQLIFEFTLDGNKQCIYMDIYNKLENRKIDVSTQRFRQGDSK